MGVGSIGGATSASSCGDHYVLRFESLADPGRALVFPCDEQGRVLLDRLGEKARTNYLYARAVVGREYATPEVRPCCGAGP